MVNLLFILTLVLCVLEGVTVFMDWKTVRYATKPAPMVALIFWFTITGQWMGPLMWFGAALVLSLIGDIFLLLPKRFFLPGLVMFLLAHVSFLIGFTDRSLPLNWISLVIFVAVAVAIFFDLRPVIQTLNKDETERKMVRPVALYGSFLALMVVSAFLNFMRPEWHLVPSVITAVGALLFAVSDSILARVRFMNAGRVAHTVEIVAYLLAQVLIAYGVLMQYVV
jgi:uncharacterized membrane protein YhhN